MIRSPKRRSIAPAPMPQTSSGSWGTSVVEIELVRTKEQADAAHALPPETIIS